tara:strand:+ start:19 stop:453 length:435 start_codon:yes stop_codon:yes gene_type:complete
MPVTFTNNWKNILDKLSNILRTEYKGAVPVYKGDSNKGGTQFIRLLPQSSSLSEYNATSETREFFILVQYYYSNKNIKDTALDHILRMVSRTEALIHDNVSMTLSDSSSAFNCRFDNTELNTGDEEGVYLVEWEWRCQHLGNIG